MAITQIGSFKQSAASAVNPGVVSTPAGAASGDLLIFFVGWDEDVSQTATVINPPAGAVLVPGTRLDHTSGGDNFISTAIYMLLLSGSPAANYTFSISPTGTYGIGVTCVCLSGVDVASPVDTKSINSGFNTHPTATGVTISNSNEWLFLFYLGDINSVITVNFPSFSYYFITNSSGNDSTYASFGSEWGVGVIQNIATGATGNYQATITANDDWAVTLVAFQPSQFAVLPTDALFFGMT